MLTKILVTLLVIAGAFFYIRRPKTADSRGQSTANIGQRMVMRYVLFGIITVSLLASGGYWYWNWQDGNQVIHVTIVSPLDGNETVYKVHKKDIGQNQITTIDGLSIRLSNQERIVIAKQPQQ
ncbi:hypothetical protein FLM48_08500 [Shewanella sp. Scap07]|uniref:hypothetical protein n=1 Tax=Shewanella sp. Scap07 TaxID=2589987 RepID=UPI0015C04FD3|nr:hypothetical protein [Shewanella sp. Scap07]QLE85125.1 hypothetical protein FLM48_08500 [Shewanella sp. Scap07]